jgi:GntR family transcriptional regulator
LYAQLRDLLGEWIEGDAWQPGDKLPSESELCGHFGVSRPVVRQALADLIYEGRIVRSQGKGSFVAQPKLSYALVQGLTGFHEDMAERGLTTVSSVLRQEITAASHLWARHLDIEAGSPVIIIDRLRFVSGEPRALVTTCIPADLCPKLVSIDLTYRSLYDVLGEECGLVIARGRRWIEAVAATARQASLLGVRRGAPLVRLESVSYLADGRAVEAYDAIHRSDRSRFEVDLVRIDPWGAEKKDGRRSGDEPVRPARVGAISESDAGARA